MALDPRAARWLQDRRGITPETAEAFGVRTEGKDLILQYPEGLVKHRYSTDADNPFGLEKDGRKFTWRDENGGPAGAGQVPYLPPDFEPGTHMILLEGETDTMACWQAAPEEARKQIVGLSGNGSWKKAVVEKGGVEKVFGKAKVVWVVFDNDDPYKANDAVESTDRAWREIKADLGRKAKRVTLPQGIKDVAEFFQQYDWAAFRVLLQKSMAPVRHYKPLDWSQPVPDTDWLLEGLLVSGETTVLAAEPGTGKSMLTSALGLAVAQYKPSFLGLPLKKHGRVLIVDEENSPQLVMQRMAALGLTEKDWANVMYLSYPGVELLQNPEPLLEQAMDFEPEYMVLDSLSQVSIGAEENSNDDMTQLFKRGINPLARETGAAVVVLHHLPTDGRQKPRGAGAIKASADQVLAMVRAEGAEGETGNLNIFANKQRRLLNQLTGIRIVGDMEKGEALRVEIPETPF